MVKIQTDKVNKKLTTFTTRKNVSFPTLPNVHLTQCDMPAISVKSLLPIFSVVCLCSVFLATKTSNVSAGAMCSPSSPDNSLSSGSQSSEGVTRLKHHTTSSLVSQDLLFNVYTAF